jgi:hypothetical protein
MPPIAYGLRADYAGTVDRVIAVNDAGEPTETETVPLFLGGMIAVAGTDFDVAAELERGDGTITVAEENHVLIMALDEYPALKRVGAPENATPVTVADRMPISRLRDELRGRGLATGGNRDELEARLNDANATRDTGDAGRAGEPDAQASDPDAPPSDPNPTPEA